MKIFRFITFFIVITLCLTNTQCDEDDDTVFVVYDVVNNEIIQIEDQITTLNLGESIYIETTINNIQNTTNNVEVNLLDFVENEKIYNSLVLYRLNNNTIERVPFDDLNINSIEGDVEIHANNSDNIFPSFSITSTYNGTDFKNKFGITPVEPGTYFIGPNDSLNEEGEVNYTISNTPETTIYITSTIINSNNEGLYEFVVN